MVTWRDRIRNYRFTKKFIRRDTMKHLKTSPVPHTTDNPIESMSIVLDGTPMGTFVEADPEFMVDTETSTAYLDFVLDPAVVAVGDHIADVTVDNGWEAMTISYPFVRPVLPIFVVYISG
jgi:hypothetical protein